MKKILLFLWFVQSALAQQQTETPLQTVGRIHSAYIAQTETALAQEQRQQMQSALEQLQQSATTEDLPLLLNVWMYFDPTDFPTRELISPILAKDRTASLKAVNQRLAHKQKWETENEAPYSDLIYLKEQLSQ
ncbi:hypothetical protein [Flavobacterium sp.]|uniref:hypothetical protein n=1 Tax=Flavobacterium sp. TaxID=239 RepID=UPI0039E3128D